MQSITILPGFDKQGQPEPFSEITLCAGQMTAIVGGTGSGKSRLIRDIEQLVSGDTLTRRKILLDGKPVLPQERMQLVSQFIAHLGQNMRFMLDTSVQQFLSLHIDCRQNTHQTNPAAVIALANRMTPEKITASQNMTLLSGGQTRALMIADIALVCQSPIVLLDEIENAGIHKQAAFEVLAENSKILLVVTHDAHTALLCDQRICMRGGAVVKTTTRTGAEEQLLKQLQTEYDQTIKLQHLLRKGALLA